MLDRKKWLVTYYPIPASHVTDKREAVQYSLLKWKGLRELQGELPPLAVNGSTCALCHLYVDADCQDCPLYKHQGGTCDDPCSPYRDWYQDRNPEPMIAALEQTLEELT